MRKLNILLILLLVPALLHAEDGFVDFIDGQAEIKSGNSWIYLDIGDQVGTESLIRLDTDSYLELSFSGIILKLTQQGQYLVSDLLKRNRTFGSSSFANQTKYILAKILYGNNDLSQSTAAGVRGKAIDDMFNRLSVVETAALREACTDYSEGRYDAALEKFRETLDFAENIEQEMMSAWFISMIHYQQGKMADALSVIDELWLNQFSRFYGPVVYLKATILVETNGYEQAISWIARHPLDSEDPVFQGVLLLEAMAYLSLEKKDTALRKIEQCIAADPDSEFADSARALLED
ncbi:MAG: hypothetical protein JW874_03365 [Spirochaetales bacterium]|nr:hypothetical protein [Spirochaetales bacterium]